MSANGEYFIGYLQEIAIQEGMFNPNEEQLITPEGYTGIWREQDIPTEGSAEVDDAVEDIEGITLKWEGVHIWDDDEVRFVITSLERNGVKIPVLDPIRAKGDWIHQLQPIVLDLLDGEPKLVKEDVEWLMPILKAKIEYFNGLIGKAEYETILHNTER